jgi:hypothetical protein
LERLVLQLDPRTVSSEFTRARVHLKGPEADHLFGVGFQHFRFSWSETILQVTEKDT